jgi:apolipoprotein N-acyltransferase
MLSPGISRRTVVQVATALVMVAISTFGYGAWRLSADAVATLTGELRPGIAGTLYTRWGDWFGWLCCVFTLAGLMSLRRRT